MTEITLISYEHHNNLFLEGLNSSHSFRHISSKEFELNSQYRSSENGDGFKDVSFILSQANKPTVLVLAHKIEESIRYAFGGVRIIGQHLDAKICKIAFDELKKIAELENCNSLIVDDYESTNSLSAFGEIAFNARGNASVKFYAELDLTQSNEDIHKGLRKSYKSLINKGKRELDISIMNADNYNLDRLQEFQSFHKQVSGRSTRSQASWDTQFEMVKYRVAELVYATWKGKNEIISASLFTDFGNSVIYAVGVYDRDQFDHALAHPVVYDGILSAKERNKKTFYLGELAQYEEARKKEYNIGLFKKGFCRSIQSYMEWRFDITQ